MDRKVRSCPCCGYSFKNFKWRRTWKYDGDVACCPNCLLPAIKWKDYDVKKHLATLKKGEGDDK